MAIVTLAYLMDTWCFLLLFENRYKINSESQIEHYIDKVRSLVGSLGFITMRIHSIFLTTMLFPSVAGVIWYVAGPLSQFPTRIGWVSFQLFPGGSQGVKT